jgi:hypothetical protein
MTGARVRWRRSKDVFEVVGHGEMWLSDFADVEAAAEVIGPASLTELRHAVDRSRSEIDLSKFAAETFYFEIYDVPGDQLPKTSDELIFFNPEPISLELSSHETVLRLDLVIDRNKPANTPEVAEEILSPLLLRMGARFIDLRVFAGAKATTSRARIKINPRGLTVGDALQIGSDILQLWNAGTGGGITPPTAADLIRAKRADLLIGQRENEWFEVKQAPYRLENVIEQIELAKDVSALANRADGGLLVIGLVTGRQGEHDVVKRLRTQPVERLSPRRYRQSLDRWIYPRLRDIVVDAVVVEPGRGLLMILIPPQPEPLWPFLVVGAIVNKRILGNHFSLVRRRGDQTVDDTAAVVHGLMVAGRAALSDAPRHIGSRETGFKLRKFLA